MIINLEREPEFSLYYLGGILLAILEKDPVMSLEELLKRAQKGTPRAVHIDFWYYALDWLYLLSLVRVAEGMIYYENKKIDCPKDISRRGDYQGNFV